MPNVVEWTPVDTPDEDIVAHPVRVFESLNLASARPPPLRYRLRRPPRPNSLSSFQVETVRYACQSLGARRRFFLGDGTGIGKGRTLAGIAQERHSTGRASKVLWISANRRLFEDAKRDTAVVCPELAWGRFDPDCPLAFASYFDMLNPETVDGAVRWLRHSASGAVAPLVFLDECHVLRHTSTIGYCAINFLNVLIAKGEADVVFSSATAASCPSHFRYARDIGLWGRGCAFPTFESFQSTLSKHGSGMMELVALHLKSTGSYVSRHLATHGVRVDCVQCPMTRAQEALYDECARAFEERQLAGGMSHQHFWQRLIAQFKIAKVLELAREALAQDKAVIIALQNTGEASDARLVQPDNPLHASTCEELFRLCAADPQASAPEFGIDPIDAVLEEFGADNVAEITGRTRRVVRHSDGTLEYAHKPSTLAECRAFQAGEKRIAVLSRAGSTGISLHADRPESKPRVHICMELPWSAEDFLQQCGRSHRSSACHLPEYKFVYSNVPAEVRFVSSMAYKLGNMGALTKADRASSSDLIPDEEAWSAPAKREVAIRILRDRLLRTLSCAGEGAKLKAPSDPVLPLVTHEQACAVLGVAPHSANSTKSVQLHRYMLHAMFHESSDTETKLRAVAMAQQILPQHATWAGGRWSPQRAGFFPSDATSALVQLMLCRRAWECRNTLGALPDAVFDIIVRHLMSHVFVDTADLAEVLAAHRIELETLPKLPTYSIQNKLLGMQLKHQRVFEQAMRGALHMHAPRRRGAIALEVHALKKLGDARVHATTASAYDPVHGCTRVQVTIELSDIPTRDELPTFRNVLTGDIFRAEKTESHVLLYKPCELAPCRRLPFEQWNQELYERRIGPCSAMAFAQRAFAKRRLWLQKARAASCTYVMATTDAIEKWESSLKTLLTFETAQRQRVIGLLLRIEK